MKQIALTQGKVAFVDDEDYQRVSKFHWHAYKGRKTFYAQTHIRINGKLTTIDMHRFILNAPKGIQVDHRDHNGLNNLRENIRLATHAQNQHNNKLRKNNKSGVNGVFWCRDAQKWEAQISVNGKGKYLGIFESKAEAIEARNKATLKYFGEFANPQAA